MSSSVQTTQSTAFTIPQSIPLSIPVSQTIPVQPSSAQWIPQSNPVSIPQLTPATIPVTIPCSFACPIKFPYAYAVFNSMGADSYFEYEKKAEEFKAAIKTHLKGNNLPNVIDVDCDTKMMAYIDTLHQTYNEQDKLFDIASKFSFYIEGLFENETSDEKRRLNDMFNREIGIQQAIDNYYEFEEEIDKCIEKEMKEFVDKWFNYIISFDYDIESAVFQTYQRVLSYAQKLFEWALNHSKESKEKCITMTKCFLLYARSLNFSFADYQCIIGWICSTIKAINRENPKGSLRSPTGNEALKTYIPEMYKNEKSIRAMFKTKGENDATLADQFCIRIWQAIIRDESRDMKIEELNLNSILVATELEYSFHPNERTIDTLILSNERMKRLINSHRQWLKAGETLNETQIQWLLAELHNELLNKNPLKAAAMMNELMNNQGDTKKAFIIGLKYSGLTLKKIKQLISDYDFMKTNIDLIKSQSSSELINKVKYAYYHDVSIDDFKRTLSVESHIKMLSSLII